MHLASGALDLRLDLPRKFGFSSNASPELINAFANNLPQLVLDLEETVTFLNDHHFFLLLREAHDVLSDHTLPSESRTSRSWIGPTKLGSVIAGRLRGRREQ